MTGTTIAAFARILTNTNSTTLSDADILTILNIKYGHRILDILKVSVDKNSSIQESYTDLISTTGLVSGDNGFNGEYAFPSNLLKPVRFEVDFGNGFVPASIYDINENNFSEVDEDTINGTFSTSRPHVRFERDSYFVRPLPSTTVTNGLHIVYEKRQTAFSALSETPEFESNLHDILAFDIAEVEALRHPNKYTVEWRNAFALMKADVERRFLEFFKNRFKRSFLLRSKQVSYK